MKINNITISIFKKHTLLDPDEQQAWDRHLLALVIAVYADFHKKHQAGNPEYLRRILELSQDGNQTDWSKLVEEFAEEQDLIPDIDAFGTFEALCARAAKKRF